MVPMMSPMESVKIEVSWARSPPTACFTASPPMMVKASVTRERLMARRASLPWTWAISWARTAARAFSPEQQRSMPRVMKIRPPGAAKALISGESMMRKW